MPRYRLYMEFQDKFGALFQIRRPAPIKPVPIGSLNNKNGLYFGNAAPYRASFKFVS